MERDPADGRITFCEVNVNDYQIQSLEDVKNFWVQLHNVGAIVCKQAGFIVYPVVRLEDGRFT